MSKEVKEPGWGYHWPVFIAVIVVSVLNWWVGTIVFAGGPICGIDWLDNVGVYVLALWWVFAFVTAGYWPLTNLGWWTRGIGLLIISWILGFFTWYIFGLFWDLAVYGFPLIANLFFWIVVTDFAFVFMKGVKNPRRFLFDLMFWFSASIFTMFVLPTPGQMPAWWFVPTQWLLSSQVWAYLTRDMGEYSKGLVFWLINIFITFLTLILASAIGHWTFVNVGDFSTYYAAILGGYSLPFLVFFGAGCAFCWDIFTIFENWPWRKIRMPWGAILGYIAVTIIQLIATWIAILVCGMIWPPTAPGDVYYLLQAFALVYCPVNWGFAIPLLFPSRRTGVPPAYTWVGQKEPGTW